MESISYSDIQQAFKKTQTDFCFPGGKLELITDEYSTDVHEALKQCFVTDEPLGVAVQLKWGPEVECHYISVLREKMSLMVVNEKNGDIMGVRLLRASRQSEYDDIDKFRDENCRKIIGFMAYCSKHSGDIVQYDTSPTFGLTGLGVLPKYRRQGLGTLLMETGLNFLGNLYKPCYVKGSATSYYSKRIFEKCSFVNVAEFLYTDYKVNGKVIFDNMGENKSMKVYRKYLK